MSASVPYIRSRLSVMMFLEFMLWASWYVPIGGYMNGVLHFDGWQIGLIMATTAIGAIVSPMFVGYVADRLFATERILAVLHLLGGACLLLSSRATTFPALFALLIINALCFMPTMALCNSLSFRNIDDPNRFSRIAVWGTIGWICSGWTVDLLLGGAESGRFFFLAGGGAIAMGLYCLTLPHTPPKGAESGSGDVMGLEAIKLFLDPSFLVFALCAFLISIPLSFYFVWGHAFLTETNRPVPTLLMTLSQFSEIVVMIIMPWFIGRYGLKTVLTIGMSAWAVRYVFFATGSFPLVILGLLVHGFCYCFVFVAAFIYVSKKAPTEISASAQSLIGLLMWGVGMLVGTQLAGMTGGHYAPPTIVAERQIELPEKRQETLAAATLPQWPPVNEMAESREAALAGQAGETSATEPMLLDSDRPVVVIGSLKVRGEVGKEGLVETKMKGGQIVEKTVYPREKLLAAFKEADRNQDNLLTHDEWQDYRMHNWPPIWLWPGLLAALVAAVFGFGGRDATEAVAVVSAPAPREEPPAAAAPTEPMPSPAAEPPPKEETIPLDDGPLPPPTSPDESLTLQEEEAPLPEETKLPADEPPPASPDESLTLQEEEAPLPEETKPPADQPPPADEPPPAGQA